MLYHYPAFIRIWHILNALFFLVLILTGLSMQYSNPENPVISFPLSVKLHNICGVGLTINYVLFFLGNLISGNGKHYRMEVKGMGGRLRKQAQYYLVGIFKKEQTPFPLSETRKFNPLQAFTYMLAMYMGVPVLIITGWGLLFPDAVLHSLFGVSGILLTDLFHVIAGFLLSVFMLIHIYLCTLGTKPGSNFRSILTGWHEIH